MLAPANNRFTESLSPHSMSLANDMQIPSPGFDSMSNLGRDKLWSGASPQTGLGGLTFDGSGLFGTGLFSGDITAWGVAELVTVPVIAYALYAMFFQVGQTKVRLQGRAQRKRVSKAKKLREKAKELEATPFGSIW